MVSSGNNMTTNPSSHLLSLGVIFGSVAGILPPLAALVAVIWYGIQIFESRTVQGWLHRRTVRNRVKEPPLL